jgi:putative intracellular protease/amidase
MIRTLLALISCSLAAATLCAGELKPPDGRNIRVAFVLSEHAVVIDFAGPWEVFQDTMFNDSAGHHMPFELYTVAASREPVHTSGGGRQGFTVTPDYSFAEAPAPDVVVIGAQSGASGLADWLRKVHAEQALILSVCTGAFRLAESGLLDGHHATTHHASLQRFANQYPAITVQSSVRYVQAGPRLVTAGGLSSGIDAALHVVAEYFGAAVAQATADEMEYQGQGWKTNAGSGEPRAVRPTIPLAYREATTHWQGVLLPEYPKTEPQLALTLNLAQVDGRYVATIDVPAQRTIGEPVEVQVAPGRITLTLNAEEGPLIFSGKMTRDSISGRVSGEHVSIPLSLHRITSTS